MNNNETGQDKRLDMSVLPDGFLICHQTDPNLLDPIDTFNHYHLGFMDEYFRASNSRSIYRPAFNHWHFNDGSMVLPLGLVCSFKTTTGIEFIEPVLCTTFCQYKKIVDASEIKSRIGYLEIREVIIAVKTLGVTPEYAIHGKELGMEVVTL